VPDVLTFQHWFNHMLQRPYPWTKAQLKHEALKVPAFADEDELEMRSYALDRKLLAAMKKTRADGMPMAGWGATKGTDGSRFIKRPETWTFPDWQFNILLKMKGTKRDVKKAAKVYEFGLATWPEQARAWPRPDENPQFYWELPEVDALEL
jgi:hypothetical protein